MPARSHSLPVFFDPHVMLKINVMKIFILINIRTEGFVVVGFVSSETTTAKENKAASPGFIPDGAATTHDFFGM
jgi:hypothetical protein